MGESINPYEAPRREVVGQGTFFYREPGWTTTGAAVGVLGSVVMGIALGVVTMMMPPPTEMKEHLGLVAIFGLLSLGASAWNLGTIVVYLIWTHQVGTNAHALRPNAVSHSPGWAVGSWFVPIATLFVPYQALAEYWRASDPKTIGTDDTSWVECRTPALFPLWWATYLMSSFVGIAAALGPLLTTGHVAAANAQPGGGAPLLLSNFFSAIAAVAIISIMKQLDQRQAYAAELIARR